MNNSENPLDMWCEDSKNNKQVFHYDTMINSNRIYYKLSGREGNFIATALCIKLNLMKWIIFKSIQLIN